MIYPIISSLQNETIKPNTRDIPIISVPVPTTFPYFGISSSFYSSPIVRMNCADIAFDIYNSHNRYEHSQNQHYNIFHNDLLKIE